MTIEKGNLPPQPESRYLKPEEFYNAWAAAFQVQSIVSITGELFIEPPALWMAALNPMQILDRARAAEIADPEPICAFSEVRDRHCPKPWHHPGSHDPSSYAPYHF